MIQLEQVKRQFGSRVLFEGLSWLIPRGARLGLVGPNGAGKTTLLGMLDGRQAPDAGRIHRPQGLRVGYLPQEVETLEGGSVLSVVLAGFVPVAELESEIAALERRLARMGPDDPAATRLTERYGELRHRYEHLEGDRLETRAKTILSGLGIRTESFHEPLQTLSGGWRMRVALARLLLGDPDLLLLDEPTNHLDLDATAWLEGFLDAFEGAFIVVSHDRYFLNRMVRELVELDRGRLTAYPGDYDAYVVAKQERAAKLEQQAKQQAREIKKVERFIERFRYKNTKAKQVQSRVRALSKVDRIRTAPTARRVHFDFPPAPRAGDVVVRAEGVVKRFGDHTVFDDLELLLQRDDRVALAGPNGTGKSTLLKLIAGRLDVDEGRLVCGHNVRVGYYAQHQLDELDEERTALEELERAAPGHDRVWARKLLGCFLFSGEDVDKSVAVLSGGEKARLALARLLVQPSNLLLLDEPTNHLDLASREMLEEALNQYGGTLVLVSHDRYFINRVATSVGEIGSGRIEIVPGDYDEFIEWRRRRAADRMLEPAGSSAEPAAAGVDATADRKLDRRRAAEERNRLYRARRAVEDRLAPIENEIARLEQRVCDLEARQADPAVYADPVLAAEAGRDRAAAAARLDELYREWEALAAELPAD